jgi:hypothetical protein
MQDINYASSTPLYFVARHINILMFKLINANFEVCWTQIWTESYLYSLCFFTCYIVGTINPSEFLQSCRDPEFLHNIDLFTILKLFGASTHFIHRTKATRKVHPM